MKTYLLITKKIIFLLAFLLTATICAVAQQPPGGVCRSLVDATGVPHKVIFLAQSNQYYFCEDSQFVLHKVKKGEHFEKGTCDCSPRSGAVEPIHPAAAAYTNIQFEFDSSVLKTSSYPELDATSADLRSSGAAIEIDGYASSEGSAAHNMKLSKDRANAVKTYLVNSGVDAKKLKVKAYGETNPIASNDTEEGRVLNRRVQFKKP